MKKRLLFVALGLVAVLLAAGQLARAADRPAQTPQDTLPSWSADARYVAFDQQIGRNHETYVTPAGGGRQRFVVVGTPRGFRPGGSELLVQQGQTTMVVAQDGRVLRSFGGVDATWSPDGGRIASLLGGALFVQDATGANERQVAVDVRPPSWDITGPAWSPNGKEIAVANGSSLVVFEADGSGRHVVFTGPNQNVNPTWSPDGTSIAFERNAAAHWEIWIVGADGTNVRLRLGGDANYRYPRYSPTNGALAFISDREHIRGGATQYQFALYTLDPVGARVPHERVADVHPYSPPAWSPTGAQLAVAAGQECQRWGLYVVRSDAYPLNAHRRSNLCHVVGTARGEVLNGTPWLDIVRGYGGNDAIRTGAGDDRIEGNDGNDVIDGGPGNDAIFGGAGDDRLSGGPGNDLIIGGNGRDRIDCGPGDDTVEAAGRLDRIAQNCEHVRH